MQPDCAPIAVFRCDASPEMGGGHAMRCAALATALGDAGWHTAFATRPGTAETVPVALSGLDGGLTLAGDPDGEPAAMAARWPDGVDLLVVDHYQRGAPFERACRPWARRILVIDDLADRPHDCDLLLDQSLGRVEEAYDGFVPEACRLLLGPRFALLRPQFSAMRKAALAHRRQTRRVARVLVSLGSSDPPNATVEAIRGIEESGLDVRADVVLGGLAPHLAVVRSAVAASALPFELRTDIGDMAALMVEADLAIGAAGTSSWERCCLALPGLLLVLADNQAEIAAGLAEVGAAVSLGRHTRATAGRIAGALRDLAGAPDRLRAMAERAGRICDGRGIQRAQIALLASKTARDGGEIRLRLAEPEDGETMHAWQSAPETRQFSRNPAPPSRTEHHAWLDRTLADPSCFLAVVLHRGEPAGVLRLDHDAGAGSAEVSIYLDPAKYRLGLGRGALALGRALLPGARLLATVLPGNEASHRLFRSAGYRQVQPELYVNEPMIAALARHEPIPS